MAFLTFHTMIAWIYTLKTYVDSGGNKMRAQRGPTTNWHADFNLMVQGISIAVFFIKRII